MSNFLEKIPVSPITSFGSPSITNGSTIGTNFSILQVGGYMEVYSLSGLTYTIPPVTGQIEFTGNTIPIHFTKGSGSVFSPDVLTLNSDNISSGRRKLGMLVYVYETEKIYQYTIDNYETLWNNATGATGPGGPTVVISDFGTTVKNNSPEGIAFINAWTSSTISGIDGYDDTNASWRVLQTGGSGVSITGGSFNNTTDTLTLNNSTGGTITITGFTDYYTTGFTFNPSNYDLTIERNDGLPSLSVNLSILASDVTITGGTYNSSTGTATFTNNTGGTFNVTGFLTGFTDIYVTGGTFNNSTKILTLRRSDNININISGFTDTFVTGATKSGTVATFTNNTGGTFTLTGLTDVFVTGGTYSSSTGITTFRNNTGGTFNISGYFKPSDDIYVTGGTVSHGPNEANNVLYLNRSDNNTVTIQNLVDVYEISRNDLLSSVIADKAVIKGKTYKVNKCDAALYDNGTNSESDNVYTTIYLMGVSNSKVSESGIGVFYTPKYSNISIFVEGGSYLRDETVIWGGYVWKCNTDGTYNSIDAFTLDANWGIVLPFDNSNEFNDKDYTIRYDDVIYDIDNDKIIYRNEENSNIVSTTIENINYWVDKKSFYNPIRAFQWGNVYNKDKGIGNQVILNSYNENINYAGDYQINFYFEGGSYLRNNFVEVGSYQRNFYFKDNSYQVGSTLTSISSQNSLFLTNNSHISNITLSQSYQDNIYLDNDSYMDSISITKGSHQISIKLNNYSYFEDISLESDNSYQDSLCFTNNSYQSNITFGTGCYQFNLNFNNSSYQESIDLQNNGKFSQQEYFDFDNGSYQSNITIDSNKQEYFAFNNGYQDNCSGNKGQSYIVIENGSQINGFTDAQDKITIKGYNLDWGSYASIAQSGLFFIHNLPNETTTSLIGKKDNRLVEVSDLYFDGNKWVLNGNITVGGLTATTLSATTYLGLPIDIRVTGATKSGTVATFTNNTGGTFTLTGLTDTFVTGGTKSGSNVTFTNNTGGTFSVTGFTDTFVTGGTYSNGTTTFTNNSGGTFNITGFSTTTIPKITASGTDTYTSTVPNVSDYTDGDTYLVRFTNGNTTTCTLNINSLGAKTLYRNNDGVLIGGDIQDGAEMICFYNSTLNGFQVIGTSPNTLIAYVTNDDSVTLTKGMVVYAFSGTGDRMTVKRASNSGDTSSAQTMGLVLSSSIGINQKGFIMLQGLLDGLNILPTSTWSDGDPVYLGLTPGSITNVKQYAPNHLVYLGFVTTASNGSAGRMYVKVQNGYELDEIHNVVATGATYGDLIVYSASGPYNLWVSTKTLTGNYTVNGDLNITGVTTSTSVSATTYQNLPPTPFLPLSGGIVTGTTIFKNEGSGFIIGTSNYSPGFSGNGLLFTTNSGNTYTTINNRTNGGSGNGDLILQSAGGNIGIGNNTTPNFKLDVSGSFGATSISATTYQNLPQDIFVTGGTYDTGTSTITFTNNSGGTFNVSGITSSGGSFTGGTVSGETTFTNGLTANTISATTITSPSISPYGLIVATSYGYQNIF